MPFELPIAYCKKKKKLFKNLYKDLELLKGEGAGMYEHLFRPKTLLGKKLLEKWSEYYTTDRKFLKDTQKLCGALKDEKIDKVCIERCWETWGEIKGQEDFIEKYQYVDWDKVEWLNKSTPFLSFMSIYNIASPVLNLLLPIIMMIIPFFLLKIMQIPITFESYKRILLQQIQNHSIGQLFTEFQHVSWNKRIYILVSLGVYFYNIYQNIVSCHRFFINMKSIDLYFSNMRNYAAYTLKKMDMIIDKCEKLPSYKLFIAELSEYRDDLNKIAQNIPSKAALSKTGCFNIGAVMKQFYLFHTDENINRTFSYSFGFNGYVDTMISLSNNPHLHNAKYKRSKKPYFKIINAFYPPLADNEPVKNDITLAENIIVTGPNAAGKTTLLKCIILNTLFTQQVGMGFYESATLAPFDFIHCYLNIPDTSGRDSLFQAEARRCKKILTFIEQHKDKKHFCIFDELYSGTNHYEAIGSAYAYLKYIAVFPSVRFMLTTHFIRLCQMLSKTKNIININMETSIKNMESTYTYKVVSGISKAKGGICVLKQLEYPTEILEMTQNVINDL